MLKIISTSLITLSILLMPHFAVSDDISLAPDVSVGWRNYAYHSGGDEVFDLTFPSIKFGITASHGKLFGNVSYETSLTEDHTKVSAPFNTDPTLGNVAELERRDLSVSVGYKVWKTLTLYGGYKDGESESDFSSVNQPNNSVEIDADGLFSGISYAFQWQAGSLAIKGAYAWMDGNLDVKSMQNKTSSSTDVNGYNLGTRWTAPLSSDLFYLIDVDYHSYEYKDIDVDEEQLTGRVGIIYKF